MQSFEFSLIGDNTLSGLAAPPSGSHDGNGNLIGTALSPIDPLLAGLDGNSGPTQTHALRPGSPAINMGDPDIDLPPDFDQRGDPFERIEFGQIDIGAFEFAGPIPDNFVVDIMEDELDGNFTTGDLSLREAIWASNFDPEVRTITFAANLDGETIQLTMGELTLTDAVIIDATSLTGVTIDALQDSRIFNITAAIGDFTLAGLRLTGGLTTGHNTDSSEMTFSGGAIRSLTSGSLTLDRCFVMGNATTGTLAAGGGIYAAGDVTLTGGALSDNSTLGNFARGGGIYAAGEVTLSQAGVSANRTAGSSADGGGIWAGLVTTNLSTVSENFTSGFFARGGGIWASNATLIESAIIGNHTLDDYGDGGGMFVDGDALLTASTVSGNYTAGRTATGGGIVCTYNVTFIRSTVSGNRTTGPRSDGGGIFAFRASVVNSTISGNSATGRGGGIQSLAETGSDYFTLISYSTITGNTADADDDGFGYGGGICGGGGDALKFDHAIIAGNIDVSDRAADVVAFLKRRPVVSV